MIFEIQNPIHVNQFVEFMKFDLHRAKVKFWLKTIFMHHIALKCMEILSKMHNYYSVISIDFQSELQLENSHGEHNRPVPHQIYHSLSLAWSSDFVQMLGLITILISS